MRHSSWRWMAPMGLVAAVAAGAEEAPPAPEPAPGRLPALEEKTRTVEGFHQTTLRPSEQHHAPLDPADMLRLAPGAAVNENGPLTGISQYRGMFGWRVNTLVGGLNASPACPNWMDPPLSFVPTGDLHQVTVIRGISPVSAGSESIGGTIRAEPRRGEFGESEQFEPHGIIGAGGQTADIGYHGDALLWVSNERHRIQASGTYLGGNHFETGNDEQVVPTEYQRWNAGFGYGFEDGLRRGSLSYSFDRTGSTGTPALPMDIRSVDSHSFRGDYGNTFGPVNVETRFHYVEGEHEMDNFSLRGPPRNVREMQMRRLSRSSARDYAYDLRGSMELGGGELRLGTDGWFPRYEAKIFDPEDPLFRIVNFNGVTRKRVGVFGEWEGGLADRWSLVAGARYAWLGSDAETVSATGLGMNQENAGRLAAAFNASDRSRGDHLLDLAAVLGFRLMDAVALEVGAARKQRAPSYQERYLWLPLESTGGLADGRNYVGDVGLRPETAWDFDIGLNAATRRFEFTPRAFYRRVDDYIQGTPLDSGPAVEFLRTAANAVRGPGFCQANPSHPTCAPLQFANVDAELWGVDAGFGVAITDGWRIDGSLSYVRGRRRDIDDDLYRIAPPNGIVALSHLGGSWSVTAEGDFFARQSHVSDANAERETDGYALLNLYGQYTLRSFRIRAGVRNVLDGFHRSHLAGLNRVVADRRGNPVDLDLGERLPGPGRSFFVRMECWF